MNIIQNIKDYQQTFIQLKKANSISLNEYLEQNNIHPLAFLHYIGLNDNLVKDFNFEEMTELATRFGSGDLPTISTRIYEKRNSISVDNKLGNIIINENNIIFNEENQMLNDDGFIEVLNSTTYSLGYKIHKKCMLIEDIEKDDKNVLKIKAEAYVFQKNGEVLAEKSYEMQIDCTNNLTAKTRIFRAAMSDNILALPNMVIKLIKSGRLAKESVEISWGFAGLTKK